MKKYIDVEETINYLRKLKNENSKNNIILCANEDNIIDFLLKKCKLLDSNQIIYDRLT